MHTRYDNLSTVVHVGQKVANKLQRQFGITTIGHLETLRYADFIYILTNAHLKIKTFRSLIETAAVYTNNIQAKDHCNRDLKTYKLYKHYLENETAFRNFQEKQLAARNKRQNNDLQSYL